MDKTEKEKFYEKFGNKNLSNSITGLPIAFRREVDIEEIYDHIQQNYISKAKAEELIIKAINHGYRLGMARKQPTQEDVEFFKSKLNK